MIDHTPRLTGVVKAALKEAAMGEPVGFHVSFGYWPLQDQQGNVIDFSPAWFICVTVRNGLAPEPIANGYPLHGLLPADEHFRKIAQGLLERCRKDREAEGKKEMAAATAIDASLKGKSLEGLVK